MPEVTEHPIAELFVSFVISGQDNQLGAEFSGPHRRHGSITPELAGFIGRRGDDAALLPTDGNRLAAQVGVRRLLDRGEKGIRIQMNDGAHDSFTRLSDERLEHPLDHQFLGGNEIWIFGIFSPEIRLSAFDEVSLEGAFTVERIIVLFWSRRSLRRRTIAPEHR
jgi:hypothetical protein